MIRLSLCLAFLAASASPLATPEAFAQPPTEWKLDQNDPNPFCPSDEGTEIRFTVPHEEHVLIQIWDAGETEVVRTLLDQLLAAGFHSVVWDGRDDAGDVVADGNYWCLMTAGDPPVFEDKILVGVKCEPVLIDPRSWGGMKSRYR